jgi:hypothetical protein
MDDIGYGAWKKSKQKKNMQQEKLGNKYGRGKMNC